MHWSLAGKILAGNDIPRSSNACPKVISSFVRSVRSSGLLCPSAMRGGRKGDCRAVTPGGTAKEAAMKLANAISPLTAISLLVAAVETIA
jgi:hypothetical protein